MVFMHVNGKLTFIHIYIFHNFLYFLYGIIFKILFVL